MPTLTDYFASLCFLLAIAHTFLAQHIRNLERRFPKGSIAANLFHVLGEVEITFGLWAAVFLAYLAATSGGKDAVHYLETRNFTEPLFVFVILVVSSTRPVLLLTGKTLRNLSSTVSRNGSTAFFFTLLTLGPLLGSFITEPAAMTVTALLLLENFFKRGISNQLMYASLGLLFVNISIGGTLTPYAAPPVLMVAAKWEWDLAFMLQNFGWKAAVAILLSTSVVTYRFRKELGALELSQSKQSDSPPAWISILHVATLACIVLSAHHPVLFFAFFIFFLGFTQITKRHQSPLKFQEALLVGFFLAGLVVIGAPQRWWLEPILSQLGSLPLYLGSMALTAITDNAALTYLGSQVSGLSSTSQYALVAGSVVGGGLTVIANAPNPAGFGILSPAFGKEGVHPLRLFLSALGPTLIAALVFWVL